MKPIRVSDHAVDRANERWWPTLERWEVEVRLKLALRHVQQIDEESPGVETWGVTFKNGRTMKMTVDSDGEVRTVHPVDAERVNYRPKKRGKR